MIPYSAQEHIKEVLETDELGIRTIQFDQISEEIFYLTAKNQMIGWQSNRILEAEGAHLKPSQIHFTEDSWLLSTLALQENAITFTVMREGHTKSNVEADLLFRLPMRYYNEVVLIFGSDEVKNIALPPMLSP